MTMRTCGDKVGCHYTTETDGCPNFAAAKLTSPLLATTYCCPFHVGTVLNAQQRHWRSNIPSSTFQSPQPPFVVTVTFYEMPEKVPGLSVDITLLREKLMGAVETFKHNVEEAFRGIC